MRIAGLVFAAALVFLCGGIDRVAAAQRIALVIGNDLYPHLPNDRQLQKAANDAEAVGDAFATLGFSVVRGTNLNRQQMFDKLAEMTARLSPGDIAAFFFAGHGVAINGVNYLLPSDVPSVSAGSETRVRGAAISEADVLAEIQSKGVRVALLVLDACRDNPFPQVQGRSLGQTRGLLEARTGRGVFTIYSAGIGQAALDALEPGDNDRNSVFTRVFIQHLVRADLHLSDLAVEVRERVAQLALRARGADGTPIPHEQTPAYYDQTIGGRVFLASRPADADVPRREAPPPAKDALPPDEVAWAIIKDTTDLSTLRRFIDEHPRSRLRAAADARIASLTPKPMDPPKEEPANDETGLDLIIVRGQVNLDQLFARAAGSYGVVPPSAAGLYVMGSCTAKSLEPPVGGLFAGFAGMAFRLVWSEGNDVYRVYPSSTYDVDKYEPPKPLRAVADKHITLPDWGLKFKSYRLFDDRAFIEAVGFTGGRMVASSKKKNQWIRGFQRCAGSLADHQAALKKFLDQQTRLTAKK